MKANVPSSSDDLSQMQKDAINRVREMQSRTRNVINRQQDVGHVPKNDEVSIDSKTNHEDRFLVNPINFLLEDTDKTLILLLLIILITEESDIGLILALMYLIV